MRKLLLNVIYSFIVITLVTSCAYLPHKNEHQKFASQCEMLTRQMELKKNQVVDLHNRNDCRGQKNHGAALCSITFGLGNALGAVLIPAVSYVVSGSYVLVGNTLHWMEYKTRCDETNDVASNSNIETVKADDDNN